MRLGQNICIFVSWSVKEKVEESNNKPIDLGRFSKSSHSYLSHTSTRPRWWLLTLLWQAMRTFYPAFLDSVFTFNLLNFLSLRAVFPIFWKTSFLFCTFESNLLPCDSLFCEIASLQMPICVALSNVE